MSADCPAAASARYANPGLESIDAVFHAAALCDYRVEQVLSGAGETMTSAKFATRDGRLHLVLAPAMKVLPKIRGWFPDARVVGWKYELVGTRDDAFARAWRQIRDCVTDACVLNGAAYGDGFALCHADRRVSHCEGTPALCDALLDGFVPRGQRRPVLSRGNRQGRPVRFRSCLRLTHS